MEIHASVVLQSGDSFAYTADQAADQVLAALGGNPTNDRAYVTVQTMQTGEAGATAPVVEEAS